MKGELASGSSGSPSLGSEPQGGVGGPRSRPRAVAGTAALGLQPEHRAGSPS